METGDFLACLECVCLKARNEAQSLTRAFDDRLRPHGLTINQFSLLAVLIAGGPSPVARLAGRLGVDRTTLTRNLALAERRGLVASAPGLDARERCVAITPAGRKQAEAALPAWREAQARALERREQVPQT